MLGQSHLTLRPCGVLSRSPGSLGTGFQGLPLALGCPRIGSFLLALSQWCTLLTAVECVRGWWFGSVVTLRGTLGVGVGSFPVDGPQGRPFASARGLEEPLPSVVHSALKSQVAGPCLRIGSWKCRYPQWYTMRSSEVFRRAMRRSFRLFQLRSERHSAL